MKYKILIENEKQENYVVAKVMRVTMLIFTFIYILDLAGIFIVDLAIMTAVQADTSKERQHM